MGWCCWITLLSLYWVARLGDTAGSTPSSDNGSDHWSGHWTGHAARELVAPAQPLILQQCTMLNDLYASATVQGSYDGPYNEVEGGPIALQVSSNAVISICSLAQMQVALLYYGTSVLAHAMTTQSTVIAVNVTLYNSTAEILETVQATYIAVFLSNQASDVLLSTIEVFLDQAQYSQYRVRFITSVI